LDKVAIFDLYIRLMFVKSFFNEQIRFEVRLQEKKTADGDSRLHKGLFLNYICRFGDGRLDSDGVFWVLVYMCRL